MILTEDIQLAEPEEKTKQSGAVRTFIKVKLPDGTFQTIIPMTNANAVINTSGKSVDVEIAEIFNKLSTSDAVIEVLCEDTETLATNMLSLVDYVDPLMEQLKSHMEVVDLGDEVESGIFDHVYGEIDTVIKKMTGIEKSISDISSKLNKVIEDNKNLTTTVTNLSSKVSSHEDTIV